jgi:hypothetical protein
LCTTGFEGLPQIPVMITGSLQGRIDLQGVPCKPYRVWVCSDFLVLLKVSRSRNMKQKIYEILTSPKIQTNGVILYNCID